MTTATHVTNIAFAEAPAPAVPMPLPTAWVRAGAPAPRGVVALRPEGLAAGLWECGPGAFDYTHATAETILVLDGGVTITTPDGRVQALAPGDFAHFPAGLTTRWHVATRVRKAFFLT